MKKYVPLIGWGFLISFIGTLPIGTLNITVANYAIQQQYGNAFTFAVAAVLVEVIIVRLITTALLKVSGLQAYLKVFKIVALIVLYVFAFASLQAAWQQTHFTTTIGVLDNTPFIYGLTLSIINPLHIPFWIGWTTVLQTKKIILPNSVFYNIYVLAIAIGTLLAFLLYAIIGIQLVNFLSTYQFILNWLVGISLLSMALWQTIKLTKTQKQTLVTLS